MAPWIWLKPLLRRYFRKLRPKKKPASTCLGLGGGWHIQRAPVPVAITIKLADGQQAIVFGIEPRGYLLVSPNRRHSWVWPARLTGLALVAPAVN